MTTGDYTLRFSRETDFENLSQLKIFLPIPFHHAGGNIHICFSAFFENRMTKRAIIRGSNVPWHGFFCALKMPYGFAREPGLHARFQICRDLLYNHSRAT